MKPKAQPCHRQDSQRDKDALGRTTPKGDGADSASPPECFPGALTDAGPGQPPDDRRERPYRTLRRSEEHTSELQSLMRISYAVFCLKKKTNKQHTTIHSMTQIHKT